MSVNLWVEVRLKEMCERITVGHVGSMSGEYKESGIPFLRSLNITPFRLSFDNLKFIDENFHQKLKKSTLRPGDVAVVRTGYPGTACVVPESLPESNCSDLVIVRPGKDLNPYFLAAIFNSTFGKDLVGGNLVGAAQQHFNITVAKELKLRFPPRSTQDKIAAVLSSYDDLIEKNRRRIELLEQVAEELYREWFVRFRFPGYQQVKFEKTVPQGWELKKLGDLCHLIKRGIAPKYSDDSPKLVINQRCIRNGGVDLSAARQHDTKVPAEKIIQHADVLINSTGVGTLGRVSIIEFEPDNLTCDTHVTICRADSKKVSPYFFACTVARLEQHFENLAVGSTGQTELGKDDIAKVKILLPPADLQTEFAKRISSFWMIKISLTETLKNLAEQRDQLLTRLISGKLLVDQLDIQFPPSMCEAAEARQEVAHA